MPNSQRWISMVSVQQWKEELLISEKNEQILKTSNIMSQMTISCIKEVGNLLALINSVRELTIKRPFKLSG